MQDTLEMAGFIVGVLVIVWLVVAKQPWEKPGKGNIELFNFSTLLALILLVAGWAYMASTPSAIKKDFAEQVDGSWTSSFNVTKDEPGTIFINDEEKEYLASIIKEAYRKKYPTLSTVEFQPTHITYVIRSHFLPEFQWGWPRFHSLQHNVKGNVILTVDKKKLEPFIETVGVYGDHTQSDLIKTLSIQGLIKGLDSEAKTELTVEDPTKFIGILTPDKSAAEEGSIEPASSGTTLPASSDPGSAAASGSASATPASGSTSPPAASATPTPMGPK